MAKNWNSPQVKIYINLLNASVIIYRCIFCHIATVKIISIIFVIVCICNAQFSGEINGRVVDSNTQQPLVGVNIQIADIESGTTSDNDGYFTLQDIPIGTQHLTFSAIGYEKRIFLNIPVTTVRPINLNVELKISPIELDAVQVEGNIFSKTPESILSTMNINNFEFRSNPGSAWDVQRTVQSAPSVVQVGDHVNEIIIRGGSPGENLFIMDNIEIQNPNHFGVEGNGGGGFSIINPLFVKNVEFTPGAFPARYGDKASSAMYISIMEGSRNQFEFDLDVSMSGAGIKVEGPIKNGRGSYIYGSLISYFDNIITNVGFTAVPHFNNHQLKLVYDLNANNKIILNAIYANNDIATLTDRINESYYGVSSFNHESNMLVGGLTLKTLFGQKGYGLITLSSTYQRIKQNVFDYDADDYPWFTRDNTLGDLSLKSDWFLQSSIGEINTGFSYKKINYDHNEWLNANITFEYDTTYWNGLQWNFPDGITEPDELRPIYYQPTLLHDIITDYQKFAYYLQHKINIKDSIELSSGIRFDYFTGTEQFEISPRLNLKYSLNKLNSAHLAFGRHYQYPEYFMVLKSNFNKNLKTKYSDQIVIGIEHFFDTDFRGTLELYYKNYEDVYTHYYWTHEPEQFPNELAHMLDWENYGSMINYGIELLLHKKLTKNWFGVVSYSWNNAIAKDIRTIKSVPEVDTYLNDGKWYPWDHEVRHKLLLNGGWKKKLGNEPWYQRFSNNGLYKILSPIIPVGDEIELSFQYSYLSGRPYTHRTYYPNLYDWKYADKVKWNGARYPDYHRLDFRFLKRNSFKKLNIVVYVNFINILNRDNVLDVLFNYNGSQETVWHFKTLPVGGITIEL